MEGHEWVWVLGEWAGGTLLGWLVAGTEHWLRLHMLVSPWMVVDSDVWWFDRSRWKHAEAGPGSKWYGWKKAAVSSICLVSFRAPATHGRLLATELSS